MKKYLFGPAVVAFLLVSCQSEPQIVSEEEIPAPAITAEVESQPDTRTLITVDQQGEGTIWWSPADEINIFYGTTGTHYTSQNAANATTAVFRTTDVIGSTESSSSNIWGLYPYDANAVCNGTSVSTTLPAAQYGVPETFDDDLFITLAHSTSTRLKFYNVCGGVKFSLSRSDITSITFRGNNNEDLAGDISLSFENGLPKATVVNGQKAITVTPKTGSTFTQGVNYYIVVLPGTLSQGFTMTFTTTGGGVGRFNYTTAPVTITRSVFSRKADIDTYATFERVYSRVLFIGNSITRVPLSNVWWGYWGMAATTRDKDYVHLVMARLQQNNPSAAFDITSISIPGVGGWETNTDFYHPTVYAPDVLQAEGLPHADTDLIVIRLGENVRDETNFELALVSLVNYFKLDEVAPNARVVITGQFWTNATRETACRNAATRTNSTFVQINQYDTPAYKERIGNPVYGDDGQWHLITDQAVADHPSDAGMQAIADEILNAILPL